MCVCGGKDFPTKGTASAQIPRERGRVLRSSWEGRVAEANGQVQGAGEAAGVTQTGKLTQTSRPLQGLR